MSTQTTSELDANSSAEAFASSILGDEPETVVEETSELKALDQEESTTTEEGQSNEPQEEVATEPETKTEEETVSLDQPKVESEVEPQNSQEPVREKTQAEEPKVLETYVKPSRIENRITQLFIELHGEENVDVAAVLKEVQGYDRDEKHLALKNLLAQRKGFNPEIPYTEEDQDILIEAEVEERQSAWKKEQEERDFYEDLVKTVEAHPELDSRNKDFDKVLHDAVEVLVENGMKTSAALSLVNKQKEDAKKLALEELQKQTEIEKQKALSGTMGSGVGVLGETKAPKTPADEFADSILGIG